MACIMLMAMTSLHTFGLHATVLPQTRTNGHHGLGCISRLYATPETALLLLLLSTRLLVLSWHLHLWPTFD